MLADILRSIEGPSMTSCRARLVCALAAVLLTGTAWADIDDDLFGAVLRGDAEAVAATLDNGADANALGRDDVSALMLAAERGHVDVMRVLLEAGADPAATRSGGINVLMHAAASGKAEAVQILIDANKVDVNARATRNGLTALRVAAATGSVDCARVLLAAGANTDELDTSGANLLFTAAGNGSVEMIDLLLHHGADVNHRRGDGYTPLDAALERQRWRAAERLLARGARLEASATGKDMVLRKLLELEPVISPDSMSLVQVVELPSPELFRAVMAQQARADYVDENGNNLLMLAAQRHHVTALQALLAAGLDANARNAAGETALTLAAGRSEYELMVIGIGIALGQDREKLTKLIFRPAQPSSQSAATARRLEAARLLLAAKSDPDIADDAGDTPLIEATRSGDAELVEMLVKAGANANQRNKAGATALLLAAQFGFRDIARTLVEAKADLDVKDPEGRTPLELARAGGHQETAAVLEHAAAARM
jgi:ankyrin repeat protein